MDFIWIIIGIASLILLVTVVKLDTFISFMLVCLFISITGGLSVAEGVEAIQKGIGSTMSSLVIILGLGAMLGKLVAESGAANEVTNSLVRAFGLKRIQFALMITGFIVGIPMFYTVGFVILVPLAIAIAHNTKLPLLYIGIPMLASLSVTHGFLPPHPAPTAIAEIYGADIGLTLLYGMITGIPAILAARFLLGNRMKKFNPELLPQFIAKETEIHKKPSLTTSIAIALMPVILIGGSSLLSQIVSNPVIQAIGNPSIAMLIAVLLAIYFLGVRMGRTMTSTMTVLTSSIAGIASVLLIISGAGALKQVLIETGISEQLGQLFASSGISPILLAWVIAALIRVSVGSATVAGLTAAGIMLPMVGTSGVAPELLVLATGAGSITLSHINDGGFWLFKEYFNVSIKETLLSWTLMETTVSVVGLLCIYLLNMFI